MPSRPMKPMQRDSSTSTVLEWVRPALREGFTAASVSWHLVAGALDGALELGERGPARIEGHLGLSLGKKNIHSLHPGQRLERAGDALDAALAGHAIYADFSGFHRLSSSELDTTETELSAIAAPAITGLSMPAAASGIPSTL